MKTHWNSLHLCHDSKFHNGEPLPTLNVHPDDAFSSSHNATAWFLHCPLPTLASVGQNLMAWVVTELFAYLKWSVTRDRFSSAINITTQNTFTWNDALAIPHEIYGMAGHVRDCDSQQLPVLRCVPHPDITLGAGGKQVRCTTVEDGEIRLGKAWERNKLTARS